MGGGRGWGEGGGEGRASGFRMQLCFGFDSDVFAKLHIYFLIYLSLRVTDWRWMSVGHRGAGVT